MVGKLNKVSKSPFKFHNSKYLVLASAVIYKNKSGDIHRIISFSVMKSAHTSPLMAVMGESSEGKWEVVRDTEVLANINFDKFENRMRELVFDTLNGDTTMELRYEDQLLQISEEYLRDKGIGPENKAWTMFRDYYFHGRPMTREEYSRLNKYNYRENLELEEPGFKDGEHTRLDPVSDRFSTEDIRAAEMAAEHIESILRKDGLKLEDLKS